MLRFGQCRAELQLIRLSESSSVLIQQSLLLGVDGYVVSIVEGQAVDEVGAAGFSQRGLAQQLLFDVRVGEEQQVLVRH